MSASGYQIDELRRVLARLELSFVPTPDDIRRAGALLVADWGHYAYVDGGDGSFFEWLNRSERYVVAVMEAAHSLGNLKESETWLQK